VAGQDGALHIVVDDGDDQTITVDPENGTIIEHRPDGSAVVQLDAKQAGLGAKDDGGWFDNLYEKIDGIKLSTIQNDLIDGVKADDLSRQGWLENGSKGMDILGLKLESPGSDVSSTGEGPVMSKVRNPLLLEACLKGWANAEAELLPANGPVKVKSDGRETNQEDTDADLLERAVNRYLTEKAPEYYPETSYMLLWGVYFRGSGFKKIYRCPMRRRPVSEKVDGKDLIVSNTSTDLRSSGRITHQIEMRPSVFKRMVLLGAYRKTGAPPPNPHADAIDNKIAVIQGTTATPDRPEDKPYTIWETQCELDLDDFIPAKSKFKGQGIPLPYLVTIDKDNEEILSIRRDWDEDDEHCNRQRMYVRYPYIPGPGFYGTGMLNLLGNASAAMTAAWREALDAGMFANFPGGLIAKIGSRQQNTDFSMGPGEWRAVETGGMKVGDIIGNLPYRDVTPGLLGLIDKITEQCKALGQGAEIPAAEGIANVPVGTMLAQIEQATKVMAAAHKGMHTAQSEDIELLVDLFRRHPEDLLDATGDVLPDWDAQRLIAALNDVKLVPVSDPNVPSHIHRVAKALGLVQLLAMPDFKPLMDAKETLLRVLAAMREDPTGLLVAQAPPPQAPPIGDQAKMVDAQSKAKKVDADIASKQADDAIKIEQLKSDETIHAMDLQKEQTIHAADAEKAQLDAEKAKADVQGKHAQTAQAEIDSRRKTGVELVKAGLGAHHAEQEHQLGVAEHMKNAQNEAQQTAIQTHQALNPPKLAPSKPKGKQ
jgi:hypothetical protein